jgi:hypothetical protein
VSECTTKLGQTHQQKLIAHGTHHTGNILVERGVARLVHGRVPFAAAHKQIGRVHAPHEEDGVYRDFYCARRRASESCAKLLVVTRVLTKFDNLPHCFCSKRWLGWDGMTWERAH